MKKLFFSLFAVLLCNAIISFAASELDNNCHESKSVDPDFQSNCKIDQPIDTIKSCVSTKEGDSFHQLPFSLLQSIDSTSQEKTTLLVFMHGAGERGTDNAAQLAVGLPNFIQGLKKQGLKNFVVFAPQCPPNERWVDVDWTAPSHTMNPAPHWPLKLAFSAIDSLVSAIPNLDVKRIYVTGLSMGGYGTWEMIQRRPDFFAAAIPICGGGDKLLAEKLTKMPIWTFHGSKDKAVPVVRTTSMYQAIKLATKLNPLRIKMTIYENKGHLIWNETYDNAEVIKWLLAQRKS